MKLSIETIEDTLRAALAPSELRVEDDSHHHVGHAGAKEGGHYRVYVVAPIFEGMSALDRHRAVFKPFEAKFGRGIHALQITARAPSEVR